MSRPIVVLFDVDGTLVRTGGSGRRALDRAFETCWGLKDASRGVDFAGKPDLRNFTEVFVANFERKPKAAELRSVMDAYLKHLPAEVRRSVRAGKYEVMKGASELLRELAKRPDVVVGLGTGNLEEGARTKLAPSKLNRYFRFGGYGGDGYERHKILKAGVRRAGVRPARVLIVGDTPMDVEAGKRAGYATIAVCCGFSTVAELKASRPDFITRDFRPLSRWLEWIRSGASLRNGNGNGNGRRR